MPLSKDEAIAQCGSMKPGATGMDGFLGHEPSAEGWIVNQFERGVKIPINKFEDKASARDFLEQRIRQEVSRTERAFANNVKKRKS